MKLLITDRATANTIVPQVLDLRAVVSVYPFAGRRRLIDERPCPCNGFGAFPHAKIALQFDDIEDTADATAPKMRDVQRFVTWARDLPDDRDASILFHCYAGVGRSPSMALAYLMVKLGPGSEQMALEHVLTVRPTSWFNDLIVSLTDEALSLGGQLLSLVTDWKASQKSTSMYRW